MHQTFYIDIDEEITSIVDRLRKAKAKEVFIVVPKHALLIQSIVNLKLLKKEAEGLKKEVTIVTQDKMGKILVEKAGLFVEQKLEDVDLEGEIIETEEQPVQKKEDAIKINISDKSDKKNRMDTIGSSEYFDVGNESEAQNEIMEKEEQPAVREKITNKELVTNVSSFAKKSPRKNGGMMDLVKNVNIKKIETATDLEGKKLAINDSSLNLRKSPNRDNPAERISRSEKLEKIFSEEVSRRSEKRMAENYQKVSVPSRFWKILWIFGAIGGLLVAVGGAYLFLPKATVKIAVKAKTKTSDIAVKGDVTAPIVDLEKGILPVKIVTVDQEISETYPATGERESDNQKARGTLTIYNEYSSSPQPLVATTRFLSEDGKLFRLIKGVTVPGTEKVGDKIEPGAIEAEVMADEAGDEYNIGPSKFTIPGFQSSGEKYNKFYAKSFKAMVGGGSGKEMVKVVSAGDIDAAKKKLSAMLDAGAAEKVKEAASSDYLIPEDAISVSDAVYTLSNSENEIADSFNIKLKAKISAFSINRTELVQVIKYVFSQNGVSADSINEESIQIDFGKSDADFENGKITIRTTAISSLKPDIDLEKIKTGILGKNEDDLKAYLKQYPEIEGAQIEHWPSFISWKMPSYASRVEVVLDSQ